MEGDRALAGLRFPVARIVAALRRRHVGPAPAVGCGAHAPWEEHAFLTHAPGGVDAVVRVVDRQRPADGFDPAVLADERIGHHAQRRQRDLGDAAHDLPALQFADRQRPHAALGVVPAHLGHPVHRFGELRAAEIAVQDRHVKGVEHVFEVLEPVAGCHRRAAAADARVVGVDEFALVEHLEAFVARQHGPAIRRPHVREDEAVALLDRIPGLAHLVAARPAARLARLLEAMALHVEEPPVITAADALLLGLAVVKRGAAVRAARPEQTGPSTAVAEQHKILAKNADFLRRVRRVPDQPYGVPVAAQQLAHRRRVADLGERCVVRRGPARVGGTFVERPVWRRIGSLQSHFRLLQIGLGNRFTL